MRLCFVPCGMSIALAFALPALAQQGSNLGNVQQLAQMVRELQSESMTPLTVPTGASITVRMIDSVNSSLNRPGDLFQASLEDDFAVSGAVVARRDADAYVKLVEKTQPTGNSEWQLELTGIRAANGRILPFTASGQCKLRKAPSAKKMLLCGNKVRVPSETLIRFSFEAPLRVDFLHTDEGPLRKRIISLALSMNPPPAVPERAIELEGRAETAVKAGKTRSDFRDAVEAYKKASLLAPWVPNIYLDLAQANEGAELWKDAISNYRLYLYARPAAANREEIELRIGHDMQETKWENQQH